MANSKQFPKGFDAPLIVHLDQYAAAIATVTMPTLPTDGQQCFESVVLRLFSSGEHGATAMWASASALVPLRDMLNAAIRRQQALDAHNEAIRGARG